MHTDYADLQLIDDQMSSPRSSTASSSGSRRRIPNATMRGAFLPGDSSVIVHDYPVPRPRRGEVLIRMKASTIAGDDICSAYRQHLSEPDEMCPGVICGNEMSGRIEQVGPGSLRFAPGERVFVSSISGCGVCPDCVAGYPVNCSSPIRKVYGSQRHGGMADYLLADEKDCIPLPQNLCFLDGANIASDFGTAWEALMRMNVRGCDRLLVTGAGPIGLAAMMLARSLGVSRIIAADPRNEHCRFAEELGLADSTIDDFDLSAEEIASLTGGEGCQAAIDCSGDPMGRVLAIRGTARWGRVALVGHGNSILFEPGPDVICKQLTIFGSWGVSMTHLQELATHMAANRLHGGRLISHCFSLSNVRSAYQLADRGVPGKIAIVFDEEATPWGRS